MLNLKTLPQFSFPQGFLWGSATAGHQIEGDNIHSQNWANEQVDPRVEAPSGRACGHWERFREDLKMLHEMGHQAYRFSVEWSRIQPEPDRFDEAALAHYQEELDILSGYGIHACVTLHHFTHPAWFEKLGGFSKVENIAFFEKYLSFLLPRIADRVDSWLVFNEFNLCNSVEPQLQERKANFLKAYARAVRLIRHYSSSPVSCAHAFVQHVPARVADVMDRRMTEFLDWNTNEFFFHAIRTGEIVLPYRDAEYVPGLKDSCDFWGVNFYHSLPCDARVATGCGMIPEYNRFKLVDCAFGERNFTPDAFTAIAGRLTDRPVWVTENGICCDDDRFRIIYMMQQFSAMKEAMRLYPALDLRAYLHWSLMDNYEWSSFVPRFGLVHVDFDTLERTPKPSAAFYSEVIRQNGYSGELAAKYLKTLPDLTLYGGDAHHIGITIQE